ncbi:MAG: hypothetical protein MOGMAGMI_00156 [Candidatus Omnitrophica bacterium]|nr:hypothetical protein [Candidatus Omnitrophota bacterium]
MNRQLYRELWNLRFTKMLDIELQSIEEYKHILAELRKSHGNHAVVPHLERLVADETKHAKLCEELLRILKRQKE